jgi:hypothetical protein
MNGIVYHLLLLVIDLPQSIIVKNSLKATGPLVKSLKLIGETLFKEVSI